MGDEAGEERGLTIDDGPRRATVLVPVGLAAAYVLLLAGGGIGVVAALAGAIASVPVVVGAVGALWLCAVVTAGLATHAFLRRRWWWGLALLVAGPVSVPAYTWKLGRERGAASAEPDVG